MTCDHARSHIDTPLSFNCLLYCLHVMTCDCAQSHIDTPLSFNSFALKVPCDLVTDSPHNSLTRGDTHQSGQQTLPQSSQAFFPRDGVQSMPQTAILGRPRRPFLCHQSCLHYHMQMSANWQVCEQLSSVDRHNCCAPVRHNLYAMILAPECADSSVTNLENIT